MSVATERVTRWRRKERKRPKTPPPSSDDDCGSLTWLLSFRLDALVAAPAEEELAPPASQVQEKRSPEPEVPEIQLQRKPPFTYPELIEGALRDRGELTVSAIYQWISDRFPYYKANDERWKNSVRHNLSINPHFRKGGRAPHGAGHLWSLAANAIDLLPLRNTYPNVIVLDEAAIAAASIMPHIEYVTGVNGELVATDNSMCGFLGAGAAAFLNPVSAEEVVYECGLLSAE